MSKSWHSSSRWWFSGHALRSCTLNKSKARQRAIRGSSLEDAEGRQTATREKANTICPPTMHQTVFVAVGAPTPVAFRARCDRVGGFRSRVSKDVAFQWGIVLCRVFCCDLKQDEDRDSTSWSAARMPCQPSRTGEADHTSTSRRGGSVSGGNASGGSAGGGSATNTGTEEAPTSESAVSPPSAEAGFVYERNTLTVEETLRIWLKNRQTRYEVLLTIFVQVEKSLNSTPLFYAPVEAENDKPMTP